MFPETLMSVIAFDQLPPCAALAVQAYAGNNGNWQRVIWELLFLPLSSRHPAFRGFTGYTPGGKPGSSHVASAMRTRTYSTIPCSITSARAACVARTGALRVFRRKSYA